VRIGYVSPDFRGHVIMYFFSPLLAFHDRSRFRIYCYADVDTPDATSRWVETMADSWVPSAGMSDAELAEKIVADGIDILVDLSGHTASNRLRLFTMKPAPVQVSWLGYPATTGLSAMDYRISDRVADPVGVTDRFHSETVIRLSGRFLCYCPDAKPPDVSPLPARANGWVTFGSFNNLAKISPDVLSLWGKLLRSIPDARLFLKSRYFADAVTRERCYAVLEAEGVDRGRIRLAPFVPGSHGHMASYAEMDISLDPFPYNGTTTTCESLWMGVPVITLAGGHHAARVGASLLTGIGMDELVASSREEYLGIAARLAGDVERLALLRKQLRQRVAQSPICDARGFARDMEEAFLVMRDNVTQRRDHATGSGK
jgi:predicted O-linked N-acetylglucosamine transferase (SPINDLY family)